MKLWISGARPKTLTTSLSSVVVGACCAYPVIVGDLNCAQTRSDTSQCAAVTADAQAMMSRFWLVTLLCVCVGVLLQIAVNYANDYSDGIRGVDEGRGGSEKKTKKPMRLTASGLVPAKHVLVAAVVSALLACVSWHRRGGCCWSACFACWPAGSTPEASIRTDMRDSANSRCSCSSVWPPCLARSMR